jgi:MSHA pilin protein MshD
MQKHNSKGFTLIELVIGIVLFSVAMVTIVSVVMPQVKKGIDPLWQVRAVSLAQSMLTEISSKAYDEASITASGRAPCDPCTNSGDLGPESGESRNNFDDIDDYNGLNLSGVDISNASASALTSDVGDLFLGFEARIRVFYDQNSDGINDDDLDLDGNLDTGTVSGDQKLISVIVITPGGEEIPFASFRKNI